MMIHLPVAELFEVSESVAYRYFNKPYAWSTFVPKPAPCGLTGIVGCGYEGPFYGEGRLDFVSERSLREGRLKAAGFMANLACSPALLEPDVKRLHPDWSLRQIRQTVQDRFDEVVYRTPPLVTIQHLLWPAYEGDYLRFEREVGTLDICAMAPDGDGFAYLREHVIGWDGKTDQLEGVWYSLREETPVSALESYMTVVYLFCCRHTGRPFFLVDMA